ncbi:protein FAM209B-like [Sturnira hondurensis]|uniref:protein FAM209B-like n=1 Tax=Sturnira hondurensis TaxID=192404 RepID=UPI00187A1143|nr:protein FAM209B-like [Sturnira hondurensis]
MRTLTWFLFLPLCLSWGDAFMFSSVRGNSKEPQGQAPCGGHFRTRQGLPAHGPGWLASKWPWLLFVAVLYAVLKFRGGHSEKSKEKNPPGLRGCSGRAPLKKNQGASPSKDFAFTTLHQLEMELVRFLSRVRHLKDAAANGNTLKLPSFEVPSDPKNVTIYEIWGEEGCE